MGEQGSDPSGGMNEHLHALLNPPATGPVPITDPSSILGNPAQHFQLDLDQAPRAIAAFRQAADELRSLRLQVGRLANVAAPGLDAVSINAAKEIGQWAASAQPGSLRSALESGAMELERTADALERSLVTYRNADESNAGQLGRLEL